MRNWDQQSYDLMQVQREVYTVFLKSPKII